ncbi:MAG: hypothetical protein CM1200mP27_12710 [Chloroflexota bacterium]|nr:MAG: hypothetical protein CM1200mP27_12710 [Chloroflexota bacterium]
MPIATILNMVSPFQPPPANGLRSAKSAPDWGSLTVTSRYDFTYPSIFFTVTPSFRAQPISSDL